MSLKKSFSLFFLFPLLIIIPMANSIEEPLLITASTSTDTTDTYVSPTINVVNNTLLVAAYVNGRPSGDQHTLTFTDNISGTSQWYNISMNSYTNTYVHSLTVYYAIVNETSSGVVTIVQDIGGGRKSFHLYQINGSNLTNPFVQNKTVHFMGNGNTSFDSAVNTNNTALAFLATVYDTNYLIEPGNSYTEGGDTYRNTGPSAMGLHSSYKHNLSNDNVEWFTDAEDSSAVIIEFRNAGETPAPGGDTCTYGGSGNWEIDLSDNCVISTNYDLGANNITWTGTGSVTFNSSINVTNVAGLPAGQTGYIGSACRVVIG